MAHKLRQLTSPSILPNHTRTTARFSQTPNSSHNPSPKYALIPRQYKRTMASEHKATKPHVKHPKFGHLPLSTSGPQDCALTGSALLNTPYFNKGAAFPPDERRNFQLTGLLPQNVQTLEQQAVRAYQQYSTRQDDLAKNTFMTSMAVQNEVLYYRVRTDIS